MNDVIITILQYILAPVIVAYVTYILAKKKTPTIPQDGVKKPQGNEFFTKEKVSNHPFILKMNELLSNIRISRRTTTTSPIAEKAYENVLLNVFTIFVTYYENDAKYWDNFFDCQELETCEKCQVSNISLYTHESKIFKESCFWADNYFKYGNFNSYEKGAIELAINQILEYGHNKRIYDLKERIKDICFSSDICSKQKIFSIYDNLLLIFIDLLSDVDNLIEHSEKVFSDKHFKDNLIIKKEIFTFEICKANNFNINIAGRSFSEEISGTFDEIERIMKNSCAERRKNDRRTETQISNTDNS